MDQFPAVGPRAPKDEFMRALGLNVSVPAHENIYRQMRVCGEADQQAQQTDPSRKWPSSYTTA